VEEAPKGRTPKPKPPPSAEATELAEHLRQLLVMQKVELGLSHHRLADDRAWGSTRTSWARDMTKLLKTRSSDRARELLAWAFSDQGGADPKYQIRVESPNALSDKWDRIESAIQRSRTGKRSTIGHYKLTGDEEFAGGEVQLPRLEVQP
jgi:hypothetical protein